MRRYGVRALSLFLCVLVSVLMFVPGARAAPLQDGGDLQVPAEPQGFVNVLTDLTKAVGVGFVVSFLFKQPGWFTSLSSGAKWWIIFSLSLGLPIFSQLLLDFVPPGVWVVLNPYWLALARGFIGWTASQVVYEKIIKPIV